MSGVFISGKLLASLGLWIFVAPLVGNSMSFRLCSCALPSLSACLRARSTVESGEVCFSKLLGRYAW